MIPARIGGREEEPTLVVAVKAKKPMNKMLKPGIPKRIGGPSEYEDDETEMEDERPIDPGEAYTDAISELVSALGRSRMEVPKVKEAFHAAMMACMEMMDKPEPEGETSDEYKD